MSSGELHLIAVDIARVWDIDAPAWMVLWRRELAAQLELLERFEAYADELEHREEAA